MAFIARLAGEGIGPFKSFDFDFSDAEGNPHPGPHIFAGINGSGKSTVLRAIAWLLESRPEEGFDWEEWRRVVEGYRISRAAMVLSLPNEDPIALAQTMDIGDRWQEELIAWTEQRLNDGKVKLRKEKASIRSYLREEGKMPPVGCVWFEPSTRGAWLPPLAAAYGPSRSLRHLSQINLATQLEDYRENAFSFEATVQNEIIQSWLLALFSKMAIARERGQNMSKYSKTLERFENALRLICGQEISFSVDIEPSLQPRLLMYGKRLDFSQLPDGVRSTVGWLADFLMRMDMTWIPDRSYVALLDEIDAHLHPTWQRSILPSIKKALPEVQVFATSHSPFVIASCPGARIHVLELDENGVARNRPPVDAPVGESILATIKDIFGVDSRFDIETERLLEEWNELHRKQAKEKLSAKEKDRVAELTRDLSSRSEELRQIVSPVVSINDSLVSSLKVQAQRSEQASKRKESKRG